MNKKMLRLFGDTFLKASVVLLGIGIVVFGIFFLTQVVSGGNDNNGDGGTIITEEDQPAIDTTAEAADNATDEVATSEQNTQAAPTTEEIISSKGLNLVVLNSTNTTGVAKGWQETLNDAGYTVGSIGNYDTELTNTKIIVTQEGQGKDLLTFFKGATIEVGTLDAGVDIQIIIGTLDVN